VKDDVPGGTREFLGAGSPGFGVGSQVAGYRLEEQVGAGGMAVVFRARDERLGRLVALKILTPALAEDDAFRQRFIRESRAAAAVDDPHIVPVFEAGEAGGVLFIAMRFVGGGDVRGLMRREGPLPPARAMAVISPVASALDAAHGAGLVHRDVKPANMLVDTRAGRPDHVYLSDFGLSKAAVAASAGLTGRGQFLGTVDYISPEQIEGGPVDGRADQYALACAAFELLAGAPPFRRDEAMAVMYAQLSEPPPPLTSRRPDLPPAADRVFGRALAKVPGDRYGSCREFADALRGAFGLTRYDRGSAAVPPADPPAHIPAQTAASVPALRTTDIRGAGDRGAGGKEARLAWPGWRRRGAAVSLTVFVAAATIIAAVTLRGASSGGPVSVPIAVTSDLPPVTGDVLVQYQAGKDGRARVQGEINGVTRGEVAELYAQPFPFRHPAAPVSSVALRPTGRTAKYAFTVTPMLATRYRVELLPSSTATAPVGRSTVRIVYVTLSGTSGGGQTCARPVCRQTFRMRVAVPASALSTEISKRWFPYFGVNLAPKVQPVPPAVLVLGSGDAHVTTSRRISATEFGVIISFAFTVGIDGYNWSWNTCSKDTEAADGIGLPGRHGCGSSRVAASAGYLG
jgi:Protein kinase domain